MLKRTILIAIAATAIVSCSSPKYTPEQTAAIRYIEKQVGPGTKVIISRIATVDSLTYEQLRKDCIDLFKYKKDSHDKVRSAFVTQKLLTNAKVQKEKMAKCDDIISELEALGLGNVGQSILCYDVKVSGHADKKKERVIFNDFYVCVGRDGIVLSSGAEKRGLHKGFGKFLPGYTEVLRRYGEKDTDNRE